MFCRRGIRDCKQRLYIGKWVIELDFIIVTGLSGAGKSRVVTALEDIGFYCVDNMPRNSCRNSPSCAFSPKTCPASLWLWTSGRADVRRPRRADINKADGSNYKSCSSTARTTFSRGTRKPAGAPSGVFGFNNILDAIAAERRLKTLFDRADYLIDTTHLSRPAQREDNRAVLGSSTNR